MKHILLFGLMLASFFSYSQYPASGAKQRLGWQTTGDGLVYRGAIADTSTLDPSGLNNAWMLLDTVSGNLYAYRIKAWRLVSGGGGGVSMPFDSVTFNINEADALERTLKYSADKGYLQYGGTGGVQIPILPGIWYVRNDDSVTVSKGMVVRASGTLGASGRIKVKRMIADGTIPAMYVLGIAMQDIATGADGYVMTQGKIRQVNTQAYSEGAVLYADVDTLGGLTQTEPGNGYLKLPIAFVVHSASNGTLAVRIDPGSSLHDLHDVDTTGRANGSVLRYDSALKYWKASTTAGIVASDTSVFVRQYQLSGTSGYLPKYTTNTTLGNSPLYNPSGNKIMLGHTSGNVLTTNIEVHSATSASPTLQSSIDVYMGNNGFADYTSYLQLYRNRSTTVGGFTRVNQGDWLGRLTFQGADSAKYVRGAQIYALTDGTINTDVMPTALRFATNPGNQFQPLDRMSITSDGKVGIGTTSPARSLHVAATDAVRIPAGSNTQRTPSGVTNAVGDLRYNTEDSVENIEWYDVTGTYRRPVISALPTGFGTAGRFAQFKAGGLDTSDVIRQVVNKIAIDTSAADSTLTVGGSAKIAEGIAAKHFRPLVSGPGARPNIGMWSNAANTLNFSTNDTSRVQISSTGAVTITTAVTGPTTPVNSLTLNRGITAQNAFALTGDSLANSAPQITVLNQDVGQSGGYVVFQKRRGASGAVQNGDELGTFSWGARRSVNAAIYASAGFRAAVNGTVDSAFVPVDFTIFTSPNTDGAPNYVPVKTDRLTIKPGGNVGIGTASPTAKLHINGSLSRNAPVTVTAATYTIGDTDNWIICNRAGTVTLTLPTASSWTGREIMVKTIQAQTVISNATNISPLDGGALTTAILPATDGAWATLVSDGTNWIIMQRGS